MIKKPTTIGLLLVLVCASVQAAGKQPRRDVMGIRLDMSEDEARTRLQKIGNQQKEEREREGEGEQEVWLLRDRRIAFLVVAFDREHKVRHIIVSARQGARVRYGDVANLKNAQRATDGRNYTYTWKVAANGDQPGYVVIARGGHPQYLASYSLFRLIR